MHCTFDCAKVELLQVYFRYTLSILHLKTDIIQFSSKVTLKHIFDLILKNVHCAQVVRQIKLKYNVYISKCSCGSVVSALR